MTIPDHPEQEVAVRRYIIEVWGDNDQLHEKALAAAVKVVEAVNHSAVRASRVEPDPSDPRHSLRHRESVA